ncbi:Ser/Thr protein kinase RdoA involved in Cpx stress response, MazF antagonist [Hathewaya proteolytica DSM 3090]|uniref:Ser/Thr protein kinase RdoA involved in Cpx stress response, MazF antagonist n=1 Tax=Hathewaya proteolytica DSM 3090 TaxID=1121331 RepID=A0A1M6KHB4_9CLOT|nr:aminoglycoside phosphotransferase family protein [Hathewaya proteolytica]SHJ58300.1 Ser/Thr protein kinase RdoA involved in Cpx stress response, MazF antagonist [Hathewaya proteolytica DSM 3090]
MCRINLDKIRKDKNFIDEFGIEENEEFSILGQGEYNISYIFNSKKYNKKLVLRIATDSQMDLNNQIEYEYRALELLQNTKRTPKPIYYDDSKRLLPYGFLIMEYLPGNSLDYKKHLKIAAEILADIHNENVPEVNNLIKPENPVKAIYEECLNMFGNYKKSNYTDESTIDKIENLLEIGKNISNDDIGHRTIINTELNSGNFLINGENKDNYLIDWEKPVYGYPAQDLGHFLAPTTTFWKTDEILSRDEIDFFIKEYCKNSNEYKDENELWKSVKNYIAINCLRGITWCSMAYAEYQNPDKLIVNKYTYEKIKSYLSTEFLDMIKREYLYGY